MNVKIETDFGMNVFEMSNEKAFELIKFAYDNRAGGETLLGKSIEELLRQKEEPEEEKPKMKPGHVYADWRQGGKEVSSENEYDFAYKGFLYVRCSVCGAVKGFNAKIGRSNYKCDECGHETKLTGMRPVHVHCKCGADFTYKTNIKEPKFIMECINCHGSVNMVENASKTCYVTDKIGDEQYYGSIMARQSANAQM